MGIKEDEEQVLIERYPDEEKIIEVQFKVEDQNYNRVKDIIINVSDSGNWIRDNIYSVHNK